MYVIGLTGGIAAGKSTVSARLAHHGAVHIDADLLAREVVEPGTPTLAAIEREFGASVVGADGRLDRAMLGSVVFSNPSKLARLNAITHPAVKAAAKRRMADALAADPAAVVVYDVPLLVEAGVDLGYDLVVVVEADEATRVRRLAVARGMDPAEARRRIRAQASDAQRRAIADVVIDSSGSLESTIAQADEVWDRVRSAQGTR